MSDIAQMIATFGLIPVVVAAVIFVVIFSLKSQKAFNEKQQQINEAQQEANEEQQKRVMDMLGNVFTLVNNVDKNTNPVHAPEEEKINHKVDVVIQERIEKLKDEVGANRVSCFRYHNGGKDMLGRSFQKMSMFYEAVKFGTAAVSLNYLNVPRSLYSIFNKKLAEDGCYYVPNLETIKDTDAMTYQLFADRDIHAVFVQALHTTQGVVIGYLTVEFSGVFTGDLNNLKKYLKRKAVAISGILEANTSPVDLEGEKKG